MVVDNRSRIPGGEGGNLWKDEQGKWTLRRPVAPHAKIRETEGNARKEGIAKDQQAKAKQAEVAHQGKRPEFGTIGARLPKSDGTRSPAQADSATPSTAEGSSYATEAGSTPADQTRQKLAAAAKQLRQLLNTAPRTTPATASASHASPEFSAGAGTTARTDPRLAHHDPRAPGGTPARPVPVALPPGATIYAAEGEPPPDSADDQLPTKTTKDSSGPRSGTAARSTGPRRPASSTPDADSGAQTPRKANADPAHDADAAHRPDADPHHASPAAKDAAVARFVGIAGAMAQGDRRVRRSGDADDSDSTTDVDHAAVDATPGTDSAVLQGAGAAAGLAGAASAHGQSPRTEADGPLAGTGRTIAGGVDAPYAVALGPEVAPDAEEYPLADPYITGPTDAAAQLAFRQVQQRHTAYTRHVVQPLATIARDIDLALIPIVRSLQDRIDGSPELRQEFLALMRRGDSPYGAGTRLA